MASFLDLDHCLRSGVAASQAMQSLSPTAYADAFGHEEVFRVNALLTSRVQGGRQVRERLAEYFAVRAEIEETYAASLSKAVGALSRGGGYSPLQKHALGPGSSNVLEKVLEYESAHLVRVHEQFAFRLKEQVEQPLRNPRANAGEDHDKLGKLGKALSDRFEDWDRANNRLGRALAKGGVDPAAISKLEERVNGAEQAWRQAAPEYLTVYQAADFRRLSSMKELLTTFETMSNDLGRERMESAERGLSHILGWEVEAELVEFVSKEGFKNGSPSAVNGASSASAAEAASSFAATLGSPEISDASGAQNSQNARLPALPRQRSGTDAASMRSGLSPRPANGRAESVMTERDGEQGEEKSKGKKKGFLSALRGNKLDRQKSQSAGSSALKTSQSGGTMPPPPPMMSAADEEAFSQSVAPQRATSRSEEFGAGSSLRPGGLKTRKSNRDSFMPSFSSLGLKKKGNKHDEPHAAALTSNLAGRTSSRDDYTRATEASRTSAREREEADLQRALRESAQEAEAQKRSFAQPEVIQSPLDEDVPELGNGLSRADSIMAPTPTQGQMNRPFGGDRSNSNNPFAASMQASAGPVEVSQEPSDVPAPSADLMSLDEPDSDSEQRDQSKTLRSVAIQPTTSTQQESDAEREAAMLRMKNTLLQSAPGGSSNSVNRRATRLAPGRERASRQSTIMTEGNPRSASPSLSGGTAAVGNGDEMPVSQILDMDKQQQATGQPLANSPTAVAFNTAPSLSSHPTSPDATFASGASMAPRAPSIKHSSLLSSASSQHAGLSHAGSSVFSRPNTAGIKVAILETVHAVFKAGQIDAVRVTGEIALSASNVEDSGAGLKLRLSGTDNLERTAPNNSILVPGGDSPDVYSLNVAALEAASSSSPLTTVFKYQLRTESTNLKHFVPIEVGPQWKLEPHQTSFLMAYNGNPDCRFSSVSASTSADPFGSGETSIATSSAPPVLHDVSFSVPVPGGISNGTLQTKPQGSWNPEKRRLLWKMDDLDITSSRMAKILARWQVDAQGEQQPVNISWRLPGRLASGLDVRLVGDSGIAFEEVVRITQSGRYQAHA